MEDFETISSVDRISKKEGTMNQFSDYKIEITPIMKDEGGGFLATFPDLPGCMADGETIEQAIMEAKDAFNCWMEACLEWNKNIPAP